MKKQYLNNASFWDNALFKNVSRSYETPCIMNELWYFRFNLFFIQVSFSFPHTHIKMCYFDYFQNTFITYTGQYGRAAKKSLTVTVTQSDIESNRTTRYFCSFFIVFLENYKNKTKTIFFYILWSNDFQYIRNNIDSLNFQQFSYVSLANIEVSAKIGVCSEKSKEYVEMMN